MATKGLKRYIKHSRQCFIGYPNTSNLVKNTPLHIIFSTLFLGFGYQSETLSLVFDTVLCKSNANVFHRNSRIFLAFRRKDIKFSMKANLQRKVTIIRDAYCFQLLEFSNDNSLGTKIDFEFTSENLLCSINDLEHLSEISLFICSAQTFPCIF